MHLLMAQTADLTKLCTLLFSGLPCSRFLFRWVLAFLMLYASLVTAATPCSLHQQDFPAGSYSDLRDSAYSILFQDSARAFCLLQVAEEMATEAGDYAQLTHIYLTRMNHSMQLGRVESARGYLVIAQELLSKQPQPDPLMKFFLMLRESQLLHLEGKMKETKTVLQDCARHCRRHGLLRKLSKSYLDLGYLHEHMGQFNQALLYADSALQVGKEMNDTALLALAYGNLGNVSGQMGSYEQALENFKLSLRYFSIAGNDSSEYANVYSNIAITYQNLKDYEMSLRYLRKTMRLDRKDNFIPGLLSDYNNLGELYMSMGRADSALYYMQLAERLGNEHQMPRGVVLSLSNQADAFFTLKDYHRAREAGERALELNADQSTLNLAQILEKLYKIEEAEGNYKAALEYHKRFQQAQDSLFSRESREKHDQLMLSYESENKERTIQALEKDRALDAARLEKATDERLYLMIGLVLSGLLIFLVVSILTMRIRSGRLLHRKNAEISAQQAQISSTLEQRELLLREVHHRVKNNLQVISSLLDLQSGATTDQAALRALENSQNRILSMAIVHQNLYQGEELAKVDLRSYTYQLIEEISQSMRSEGRQFSFELDMDEVLVDIDSAVPIGLILNELITNSFKHGFSEQPEARIEVQLKLRKGNGFDLRYSDNGTGITQDQWNIQNGSLGLRLIRMLTRQLNGTVELQAPSTFWFSLNV